MRARGRAIPPASDEIRNWLSLAETCRHILLAVSGGPDSVAMMRIVVHWTRTLTGVVPRLSVASVDHGLRPESAGEAEAVSRWAAETGLASAVLRWAGEKPRSGVMAAARDARHRLLSAHADAIGADALMLAHHADDQAETVLMRLAAGSGLTGLAGMAPESRWGALRVLRPFLACPGERLRAALLEDGHPFIADPSNDHPAYARVRLRQARAVLEREGLDQGRITRFADRVRRADQALDTMVEAARRAHQLPADRGERYAPALFSNPDEIILRVLIGAVERVAGGSTQPGLGQLERLLGGLSHAFHAKTARRCTLGGVLVAIDRSGRLSLRPEGPRHLPRGES